MTGERPPGGRTRPAHLPARATSPTCPTPRSPPRPTREENYFRYARTRFALDARDCHAVTADDPARKVPNPAKKTAAARVRDAEHAAAAAQAARDEALVQLRSPAPGQAVVITNPQLNALNAPAEAALAALDAARAAAAATPPRIRLGDLAPDSMILDTEVKLITHAIRMAAFNAKATLARALNGHYARAEDEAYAVIREALAGSGDIQPAGGQLRVRLGPFTAPRRTRARARAAGLHRRPTQLKRRRLDSGAAVHSSPTWSPSHTSSSRPSQVCPMTD